MRRLALPCMAIAVLVGAAAVLVVRTRSAAGAGVVTVELGVNHSRYSTSEITVRRGQTVRFVVRNDDPILHELVVGPPELHAQHEVGKEAAHAARPGELTVQPGQTATTDYTFDAAGSIEFACHLPRHRAYGMTGQVHVIP